MIIRDGTESLEITLRERGPIGTQSEGDLRFEVAVVGAGFTGRNDAAWVQGWDWDRFHEDLARLEQTRRGQAEISGANPNDFQLRLFARDSAGHMVAEGWVGRDYAGRVGGVQNRVSFRLEVDPSALPAIAGEIRDFRNAS